MPEEIQTPGATGDAAKDYAAGLIRDPKAEPVAAAEEVEPAAGATGVAEKDYAAGLIRDPDVDPDAEPVDATLTEVEDIDDTTKVELQDRAIELGLPYSGTKAEIAERIRDAEAEA